jgi:hypothetical protein
LVGLEEGVTYKLGRGRLPSVEGYAIIDGNIYLLQSTVSPTPSGVRYDDVETIIAEVISDKLNRNQKWRKSLRA